MTEEINTDQVAVLVSGGIESAILAVDLTKHFSRVHPIYIQFGLRWESVELDHLKRFLLAVERERLASLTILQEPVAEVYDTHWSVGDGAVPDENTPDEAVYLPGRNLLFLTKASVWCHLRGVNRVALGSLGTNPFQDSTPAFFDAMEAVANRALGGTLRVLRPFDQMHKEEVLKRGKGLPLQHTFSCLSPVNGFHCGRCNKCAERRHGFLKAGIADPTDYAKVSV